jgi:hypothetical protein
VDVTFIQANSGRVLATRELPDTCKAEILGACAEHEDYTLDGTMYRVKGVRISHATTVPQTMKVSLEYLREVPANAAYDC